MGNLHTIFGEMVAKSIGLQDAVIGEGRICDAGTEIVSGIKIRAERDKLVSCNIIYCLPVSDQKEPHPAAWEREKLVFSFRSCLMMLREEVGGKAEGNFLF